MDGICLTCGLKNLLVPFRGLTPPHSAVASGRVALVATCMALVDVVTGNVVEAVSPVEVDADLVGSITGTH